MFKFISEALVENVEILERIANTQEPPLALSEIEKMRDDLVSNASKEAKYADELKKMDSAFRGRGELSVWKNEVLNGIDKIFVACYTYEGTQQIADSLFFPNSADNKSRFHRYYIQVDEFLRQRHDEVPMYCREYFAYYTIWHKMDYKFPMPLGTSSVIMALHNTAEKYKEGICEVSTWFESVNFIGHVLYTCT